MGESQPLEDVVHAVGLDLAARPRDEPHGRLQVPLRLVDDQSIIVQLAD